MNRKSAIIWISSILIFVVFSLVIPFLIFNKQSRQSSQAQESFDGFMTQATTYNFNSLGQLQKRIIASKMQHYPTHDQIIFTNPDILIYTRNRIPWHITALRGTSKKNNQVVRLYDHVKLHQSSRPNHPATTIVTSQLTIYPKKSFAHTDQPATIIRPDSIISGTGVNADLQKGIFNLISHSRGIYVAQQTVSKQKTSKTSKQ